MWLIMISTIFGTLQEFFNANPLASVEWTVKQSYETIRLNAQWLGWDKEAIET